MTVITGITLCHAIRIRTPSGKFAQQVVIFVMMSAMETTAFWDALDELIRGSRIVIDRPAGSVHPRFPDVIYPLDYGYLDDTHAVDGAAIDIWVGSGPRELNGCIHTVDLGKRDVEIKLLYGCEAEEIATIVAFHNRGSQVGLHMPRSMDHEGGRP